jgi:hypothetical protein
MEPNRGVDHAGDSVIRQVGHSQEWYGTRAETLYLLRFVRSWAHADIRALLKGKIKAGGDRNSTLFSTV